jgi:hypothetical protein
LSIRFRGENIHDPSLYHTPFGSACPARRGIPNGTFPFRYEVTNRINQGTPSKVRNRCPFMWWGDTPLGLFPDRYGVNSLLQGFHEVIDSRVIHDRGTCRIFEVPEVGSRLPYRRQMRDVDLEVSCLDSLSILAVAAIKRAKASTRCIHSLPHA